LTLLHSDDALAFLTDFAASDPEQGEGRAADGHSSQGEAPLSKKEMGQVLGRPLTTRQHAAYAAHWKSKSAVHVYRALTKAVDAFNISEKTKRMIIESLEPRVIVISKGHKLSVPEAVLYLVASEMRARGMGIVQVEGALARAGFTQLRLGCIQATLSLGEGATPGGVSFILNGQPFTGKRRLIPQKAGLYLLKFNPPLQDILRGNGWLTLELAGDGAAIIDFQGRPPVERGTARVKVDGGSRFSLFRLLAKVHGSVGDPFPFPQAKEAMYGGDAERVRRKFDPGSFPISRQLMEAAGCLAGTRRAYSMRFEEKMKDGRQPSVVARESLLEADSEVYAKLSEESRSRAFEVASRFERFLTAGDAKRIRTKGLLVPSELIRKREADRRND
jgi:hypothetical protein